MNPRQDEGELLRLKNIYKSFGEVKVLRDIDFHVGKNEIVGLVGDNGAGKSTLIKIITGVHLPTAGDIYYKGERITIHSVKRSRELGIETVYQERALADQQSMWRNLFAGREVVDALGFLKVKEERIQTERLLREQMGYTSEAVTVESDVKYLSGGEKQGIAISRALFFNADLIILDEPTTGLSLSETQKVLDMVTTIKRMGKSAIFISHNIYYVYPVVDRFVILDRGKIAGDILKKDITQEDLVNRMLHLAKTGTLT
jgi:simple sugar transport system ATP-binding protein